MSLSCPARVGGHTKREHTVAVNDSGIPTIVAVCDDCGKPQWRAEPEEIKEGVLA